MSKQRIKTIFLPVVFPLILARNTTPSKGDIGAVSGAVVGGIVGASAPSAQAGKQLAR